MRMILKLDELLGDEEDNVDSCIQRVKSIESMNKLFDE